MKKILSVMLLLSCLLTICSCSFIEDKLGGLFGGSASGLGAFEDAIKNSNASNVTVESVVETELGTLSSKIVVAYKADGSAVITYTYEKFNLIGEGADNEDKTTTTVTINRAADGTFSGDMPEGVDLSAAAASPALNLAPIKDAATINESSDVLTATVPAANTAEVFGSEFSKDVNLEISLNAGVLKFIELTFEGGSITYTYA